jgi:hypothetical protein
MASVVDHDVEWPVLFAQPCQEIHVVLRTDNVVIRGSSRNALGAMSIPTIRPWGKYSAHIASEAPPTLR